jgi:hypothetical protein
VPNEELRNLKSSPYITGGGGRGKINEVEMCGILQHAWDKD